MPLSKRVPQSVQASVLPQTVLACYIVTRGAQDRMPAANQLLKMNEVDPAPEATTPEQMEETTKLQLSGLLQRSRSAEFECAAHTEVCNNAKQLLCRIAAAS